MEIAARKLADTAPMVRRSRAGSLRFDGRSRTARRVKELAAGYIAQLGGGDVDAATLAAVKKAAELVVVAEKLRGRALRGESIDLSEMVKVQGVADRAVRALGIKPGKPVLPSLAEHLARCVAERAGERSSGPT